MEQNGEIKLVFEYLFIFKYKQTFELYYYYHYYYSMRHAYKVNLMHKYGKPDIPRMTSNLIRYMHPSQMRNSFIQFKYHHHILIV